MFNLMKEVRNRPVDDLRGVLGKWLASAPERFDGIKTFRLNQRNGSHIHYPLARMTAWLDERLGTGVRFSDYVDRSRKHPIEVEHIWANHFERHTDEFSSQYEFEEHRNKFGYLLLLPKDLTRASATCPTTRRWSTTTRRTLSPGRCTLSRTRTTRHSYAFGASTSWPSSRIRCTGTQPVSDWLR